MSEATRAIALTEAVKTVGASGDADEILKVAETFHKFVQKDNAANTATVVPAKEPAPPAKEATPEVKAANAKAAVPPKPTAAKPAVKPVAKKPAKTEEQLAAEALERANAEAAAEAAAEEAAESGGGEITIKEVEEVISALLAANKRAECVKLLKDFKATSKSGVKAEDYEAFVAQGNDILNGEDLTS